MKIIPNTTPGMAVIPGILFSLIAGLSDDKDKGQIITPCVLMSGKG